MPDNVLNLKDAQPGTATPSGQFDAVRAPAPSSMAGLVGGMSPLFGAPAAIAWKASLAPQNARHAYRQRVLMGGIAAVGMLGAIIQRNWLFAAVILVSIGTWYLYSLFHSEVSVAVDEHGVHIDGNTHAHPTIESFAVLRYPNGSFDVSLRTTSWLSRRISLPLGTQDPSQARAVLMQYIPEEPHDHQVLDLIERS